MLSHVARVSLFQNINERRENLCLEFFLDKIDYAVLKYLIILVKFIVISSKLSSEFLIYFLIKKIRLYLCIFLIFLVYTQTRKSLVDIKSYDMMEKSHRHLESLRWRQFSPILTQLFKHLKNAEGYEYF